jgi:uncharacterized protein (TIGR02147 family)
MLFSKTKERILFLMCPTKTKVKYKDAPIIYDYFDYRAFLKDIFNFKKQKNPHFSYRLFAGKAGFASSNFLKLVIDGKRNLTNESIVKVAKGFGLKKQERDFFENLVFMNQASTNEVKNHYYKKMISLKGSLKTHLIEKASYNYFTKWYYPAIREIVLFGGRKLTSNQIAALLNPKITPKQAEKATELLLELGLIRINKDGLWEQSDKVVSTGPEVKSIVIPNFHREMIRLAGEALDRHPSDKRDVSALTLSVKKEELAEIKERIAAFRKDLLELASGSEDSDMVIQINIQAFPLTEID